MKRLNKILALLLSGLMTTAVFVSCGDKTGDSSSSGSQKEDEIVIPKDEAMFHYNGTHIYTANDTNQYLVQDGKTDYKIVIPANYSASIRTAKAELIDLFGDATGITLQVVTDDQVANASSGKFISLGRTKLLEESGIVIDSATLTADGHRIVTKGDDVFLCGGADEGTVFAVYTFMNITFNYETFFYDCKEIEHTREKKLKNFDVTDIPDFKSRWHSADAMTYDSTDYDENMYAWRMGYYGKEANRGYHWMPVHEIIDDFTSKSSASTNARRWFPEWLYKDVENYPDSYHPKWFSDNGGEQLCFSAHGDEAEYEAMLDVAFRKVESHLKHYTPDKYPRYSVMSLTHMDNRNYCTCQKCAELSSYYGDSQAAVQVLFMNDLAERVDELLEANKDKDWYREDFRLLFFAYNHNFTAPARYDAVSKTYVPIDDKVRVHDRVIAWFCREGDGQREIDDPVNANLMTTMACWAACADHIYYWDYGTNFASYLTPNDTFQYATPKMYAFFCNYSDDYWFTQYQDHNPATSSCWTNLKVYLTSKLAWDTSLNEDELIDKWFKAMYKDAAPIMKKLFMTQRSYQRSILIDKFGLVSNGDGRVNVLLVEYWPIGLLEGWLDEIDKAKAAVSRYQITNPTLYETIIKHIEVEAMSYMYIILETQGFTIASEKRMEYINRIKQDLEWPDFAGMVITSKQSVQAWVDGLPVA